MKHFGFIFILCHINARELCKSKELLSEHITFEWWKYSTICINKMSADYVFSTKQVRHTFILYLWINNLGSIDPIHVNLKLILRNETLMKQNHIIVTKQNFKKNGVDKIELFCDKRANQRKFIKCRTRILRKQQKRVNLSLRHLSSNLILNILCNFY